MKALSKYLKFWHWFIASIVICISASLVYLYFVTPSYKISATLFIQEDKKGDGVLKETAFSDLNMFHTAKSIDNEIQVLRSTKLLEETFKELSLNTRYFVKENFLTKEAYGASSPIRVALKQLSPSIYGKKINIDVINDHSFGMILPGDTLRSVYRFGQAIINSNFAITIEKGPAFKGYAKQLSFVFVNLKDMARSYSEEKLDITPVIKDANTLNITMYDEVPQRGVDILTKLIDLYNQEGIDDKNRLAMSNIDLIDNRLKYLTGDLVNVEQSVEEYKKTNRVTDIESDAKTNLQKAEEYKQQLESIRVQLSIVKSIENYFSQSSGQFVIVPSTLGLQDPTLLSLIGKFNDLQQEYQRLLRNNQPGNPLVVSVKDQLASLKQSILENLKNIKNSLIINRDNLAENSSKFESRIRTSPVIERGLQTRDREQIAKVNLFQYLIQKREEIILSLSANLPAARVINLPYSDSNPSKPKRQFIYLYAMLLGGIIPVFLIHSKEILSKKVATTDDINGQLKELKVLGELCHIKKREDLMIGSRSRNNISELFRYIRNNLALEERNTTNQVLLVTSSIQGEGKTFVSINLGVSLSTIYKKVVILEFDLRKPDLILRMNIDAALGITDYLNSDSITVNDIIKPSKLSPNLYVIGCGSISADPGEEILKPKIGEFFKQLRLLFDYVIVDTSPVGLVADAFSLVSYTDSSLYVIRYNYTPKSYLGILEDIYRNNKLNNPMLILNDGKDHNLTSYAYGSMAYDNAG